MSKRAWHPGVLIALLAVCTAAIITLNLFLRASSSTTGASLTPPLFPGMARGVLGLCTLTTQDRTLVYNGPGLNYHILYSLPAGVELLAAADSGDGWFRVVSENVDGWIAALSVRVSGDACTMLPLPTATAPSIAQIPGTTCLARSTLPEGTRIHTGPGAGFRETGRLLPDSTAVIQAATTDGWLLLRYEYLGDLFQGYAPRSGVTTEGDCDALPLINIAEMGIPPQE